MILMNRTDEYSEYWERTEEHMIYKCNRTGEIFATKEGAIKSYKENSNE
jgi:hypothetical protein